MTPESEKETRLKRIDKQLYALGWKVAVGKYRVPFVYPSNGDPLGQDGELA